jgi:hypothetical protein
MRALHGRSHGAQLLEHADLSTAQACDTTQHCNTNDKTVATIGSYQAGYNIPSALQSTQNPFAILRPHMVLFASSP